MNQKCSLLGVVVLAIGLSTGCGGGSSGPNGHLIEGQKPNRNVLAEQIRQQHKIHVNFTPDDTTKAPGWYEVTQDALVNSTNWNCQFLSGSGDTDCSSEMKSTGQRICSYINLLRVMEAGIQPYVAHTKLQLPGDSSGTEGWVTIPRQSVATIAVLAQYLNESPLLQLTQLEYEKCSTSEDGVIGLLVPARVGVPNMPDVPSVMDQIVKHIKVSADLTEEMTNVAVKNILAAADGTRSSAPPGLGAEKQSWTQPILSRSAAANMLLGGNFEEQPGLEDGFCPGRPLGAGEKKAVELLRTSGVSIGDLADPDLSTNALLHSDTRNASDDAGYANPQLGSVAVRLAILTGNAVSTNLPAAFGLSESDFDRARKYLVAESDAFGRDRTLTSGTIKDSTGKNTFNRYAASTLPASVTPDSFYAAMTTGSLDPESVSGALAHAHYFAAKQLQALSDIVTDYEGTFPTDLGSIRNTIASGLMWAVSDVSSVITIGKFYPPGAPPGVSIPAITTNVPEPGDKRNRLLVKGETALNCAMTGRTGTEACNVALLQQESFVIGPADASMIDVADPYPGGSTNYSPLPSFLTEGKHYYLLTQKDGTAGKPGDFKFDLGFVYHSKDSKYIGVRSLQSQAADALRPSESWCSMPRKSCAGASFDERLPLEDELTGDSDGVESSWKHYLTLAKEAASQADSLGQSYVEASLQFDQKISDDERYAESRRQQLNGTIETLQDACGTELDIDVMKEALFGNVGSSCTSLQQCTGAGTCAANGKCQIAVKTCSNSTACGDNQSCIGGVCMVNLAKTCSDVNKCAANQTCTQGVCLTNGTSLSGTDIEDVKRLQRCIAVATIPLAGLGDQPLCVATVAGDSNNYCPKELGKGIACPSLADLKATSDKRCETYQNKLTALVTEARKKDSTFPNLIAQEVKEDALLRLFSVSGSTGGTTDDSMSRVLAEARKGTKSIDASMISKDWSGTIYPLGYLGMSDYFLPTEVAELAKRIGFEARFGTYSAVTLDNAPIYATGALGSPSMDWPCASAEHQATGAGQRSLFETYVQCEPDLSSNDYGTRQAEVRKAAFERAKMNDRLMRAVIALRFISGVRNTSGLILPLVFPKLTPAPSVARRFTYDPDGRGSPFLTVFETRMTSKGATQSIFWNDQDSYPATHTMWQGNDPTLVPLAGAKLTAGGQSWDVWFGTGELNTTITKSGGWHVNYSCHLTALPPFFECEVKNTYEPTVDPVSLAAWLRGLYRTTLPIDSSEETKNSTDWYQNALKNLRTGIIPQNLPGHILFDPTATVSKGSASYSAYASNATLAFGEVEFSSSMMLDALELAGIMKGKSANNIVIDLDRIPTVTGPQDFPALQAYMDGLARRIEDWAGTFVLPQVPYDAMDFSRSASKAGAFPKLGGSFATAVSTLRGDLVTLSEVSPMLAQEVRLLGLQLAQAKTAIAITNNGDKINQLQKESRDIQRMTDCASAMYNTGGLDPARAMGAGMAAAAVCIGGVAQGMIDSQVLELQQANSTLTNQQTLIQLQQEILKHGEALQKYTNQISDALENIDGHLAEIERQRDKARRAAVEAMRELAFESPASKVVVSDMASIRETSRVRYEYAFDVAKRAAFLARRAIEQRLAINMDEMVDDMPLVEAPQRWAGTVCERSGIDWSEVQASHPDAPASFADSFIGDYVDKLSRVVESYRLDHNFHEGTDTSVVSLRDDVVGARAPCDVEVNNLFLNSTDISVQTTSADLLGGWRPAGCNQRPDSSGNIIPPENCVLPVSTDEVPYPNFTREWGAPRVFRLAFGADIPGANGTCPSNMTCDYNWEASWSQRVRLKAGRYRFSWYSTSDDAGLHPQAYLNTSTSNPSVTWHAGGKEPTGFASIMRKGKDNSGAPWYRFWAIIDVQPLNDTTVDLDFDFYRASSADWEPTLVAGPMLENLSTDLVSVDSGAPAPKPFAATTDTRVRRLDVCQDTSGDVFRSKWARKCVPMCPDGNTGTCPAAATVQQCYWEVPFTIAQSRLLAGQQFKQAGFAQGNFNYRINSVGINVVGTGVKNCANTLLPSTCYSSGNITYSLDHIGPYMVRNYGGTDYETKLFTGHIEHARGLAAERYITNPISSADQQLLDQYMRAELQGRPLDGNFILKIWDDPNTSFGGVQDIQVVLKYSYWTRFQ